jgi:hypothetical protein
MHRIRLTNILSLSFAHANSPITPTGNQCDDEHTASEGETMVDAPISSAVLDALSNQDIMQGVLEMLQDSLDDVADVCHVPTLWHKELYQLLLVSKSFFEIAVQFLWENMHSLLPCFSLIAFLPSEGYRLCESFQLT